MRRLLAIFIFVLLWAMPAYAQDGDLFGRVNNLRTSLGLAPYTINGALSAAAQSQAQWMADNSLISHNRPDGSGPRSRAVGAGYVSADVAENIYGGTNASAESAWAFWVNSPIHYAGMTNSRYQEMGVGVARGSDFTTFVLVFGNPGGPAPGQPPAIGNSGGGGNGGAAAPPSFVLGQNEQGFIMHQIQPGDTLGDIALLYGYTWDDIPYMKEINGLQDNALEIGAVFLVPPYDGTYTPTPGGGSPATATPEATQEVAVIAQVATITPLPTASPTHMAIATAAALPEVLIFPTAEATQETMLVAAVGTQPVLDTLPMNTTGTITRKASTPWLAIALTVQVGLLVVAGFEFARRSRRGKKP